MHVKKLTVHGALDRGGYRNHVLWNSTISYTYSCSPSLSPARYSQILGGGRTNNVSNLPRYLRTGGHWLVHILAKPNYPVSYGSSAQPGVWCFYKSFVSCTSIESCIQRVIIPRSYHGDERVGFQFVHTCTSYHTLRPLSATLDDKINYCSHRSYYSFHEQNMQPHKFLLVTGSSDSILAKYIVLLVFYSFVLRSLYMCSTV